MPLKPLPHAGLDRLLRAYLCSREDEGTLALMRRLRPARRRRYLTSAELEAVCRWKSARAIHHIRANTAGQVRSATRQALGTRRERQRLEALRALHGVSVPMASAILTLLDPRRYGVLDIRVWQLLYHLGVVGRKPGGSGFDFDDWSRFLAVVRRYSLKLGVKARDIERTLFIVHREHQQGRLYAGREPSARRRCLPRTSIRQGRSGVGRRRGPAAPAR
jgi:hypothetical protein